MKRFFLFTSYVFLCAASYGQRPKYYVVPQVKAYFTYYKNNTINYVFNDTLKAAFNKYNDSSYRIVFYAGNKLLTKCDCLFKGEEIKEYANIPKGTTKLKVVRDSFNVRQLVLIDTSCLKRLPSEILRKTQ